MEKTVQVDGKEVRLKATAAVPRLYRIQFKRDILRDMSDIQRALEKAKGGETIPPSALELFENVAYIMAKHADPEQVPGEVGAWLDGFETFSIYQVFPAILEMWEANMAGLADCKKK